MVLLHQSAATRGSTDSARRGGDLMDQCQRLLAGENGTHKDGGIDRNVDDALAKDGGQLIILCLFLGTGNLRCRKMPVIRQTPVRSYMTCCPS